MYWQVVKKLIQTNGVLSSDDVDNGNLVIDDSDGSSLIQSVLKAIEEVNVKDDVTKVEHRLNGRNLDPQVRDDNDGDRRGADTATRPVCFTSPFHSKPALKPIMEEESISAMDNRSDDESSDTGSSTLNTAEDGTANVLNQISTINVLVSKFAIISGMVQDNLNNKIQQLEVDK